MFKVGDYLVYRRDVCEVENIKDSKIMDTKSYVLRPINDDSLKIEIPITNKYIRSLLNKEDVEIMINNIPKIEIISNTGKLIENEYKKLINSLKEEDLIKIIKTTYKRNKERMDNKKRASEKDESYFKLAEQYLYSEIALVLDMDYDTAKNYIVEKVSLADK